MDRPARKLHGLRKILEGLLYGGGLNASRVFYAPTAHDEPPFTAHDDYSAVVRVLGIPAEARRTGQYQILSYPQRGIYVLLRDGRYAARSPR